MNQGIEDSVRLFCCATGTSNKPNNLNVNCKKSAKLRRLHISSCPPAFSEQSLKFRNLEYFMQSLVALPTSYWNETNMNLNLLFPLYSIYVLICRYYVKYEILSQKLIR